MSKLIKCRNTTLISLITLACIFLIFIQLNNDYQFYSFIYRESYAETQIRLAGENVTSFLAKNSTKYITLILPSCGGLCNMFYRYLSVYGIGRSTNRTPFMDESVWCFKRTMPEFAYALPNLHKAIKYIKPRGKRAVTFGMGCCRYDNVTELKKYENDEFLYIRGDLLQAFRYFHEYKNEIRYLLDFSSDLRKTVDEYAYNLFGTDKSHKMCVHTRLGDFKQHVLLESTYNFTNPAITFTANHLKKRYNNISLVLLGIDADFNNGIIVSPLFDRKYQPKPLNRTSDIYFASYYCDSLLITASGSTFAWWIGYLMDEKKQSDIFYNIETAKRKDFGKNVYDFDSFPVEWKRLRLFSNQSIGFEPRWHFQIKD